MQHFLKRACTSNIFYVFLILLVFSNQKITAQCSNPVSGTNFLVALTGNANDLHAGDKVLKTNAVYSAGVWYDAVITILTENVPTGECSIGPIAAPDNGNLKLSNIQPDENPYITYNITFVVAGSATAATPNGTPVTIPIIRIVLQDLDGANTGVGRNYTDIGGYNNALIPDNVAVGSNIGAHSFFTGGWSAPVFSTFRTPAAPSPSVSVLDATYYVTLLKNFYSTNDFVFGTTRDASIDPGVPSVIAQRLIFHEFYAPCPVVAPVKLSAFKATNDGCTVKLSWHSEYEINFKEYVIEYSQDGSNYKTAGIVKAVSGNSNYQFLHQPETGKAYYRLKQVDTDGRYEYSTVITSHIDCNAVSLSVAPNPVKGKLSIRMNNMPGKTSLLQLHNSMGQLILQKQLAADSKVTEINTSSFSPGVYSLRIISGGKKITTSKIIVEKAN